MSKNSRHGSKMNKRFEMEEKKRRERMGLPTEVSRVPEPQTEPIGEVPYALVRRRTQARDELTTNDGLPLQEAENEDSGRTIIP